MDDEQFSVEKPPLVVGYGYNLDGLIDFQDIMYEVCEELHAEEGPGIPIPYEECNYSLDENEVSISIFGKTVFQQKIEVHDKIAVEKAFRECFSSIVRQYRTTFDPEYLFHVFKLDEMQKNRSYDAGWKLYVYYNRIVKDRKQAFHWLKMISRYRVPNTIERLSECYKKGYGCKKSDCKSKKLLRMIGCEVSSNEMF